MVARDVGSHRSVPTPGRPLAARALFLGIFVGRQLPAAGRMRSMSNVHLLLLPASGDGRWTWQLALRTSAHTASHETPPDCRAYGSVAESTAALNALGESLRQ